MRYKELAENKKGRDFVLGDLHGCYTILKKLLTTAGFNTEIDRLFLVGDLIDRGPESEKCLQLLMEPWCHAVQGNHEQIFCDAVNNNITWMTINDYWQPDYGGGWTRDWFERNAPELKFWASMIKEMPYVIHVKGSGEKKPFWVVHAELWFGKSGVPHVLDLKSQLDAQKATNETARQRNEQLTAEVSQQPMQAVIGEAVDLVISIERAGRGRRVREVINVEVLIATEN